MCRIPPPPPPAHQLVRDLREFRRWWRPGKNSVGVPPPPPPLKSWIRP